MYGQNLERYPVILGDEGALTLVEAGEALRNTYLDPGALDRLRQWHALPNHEFHALVEGT